MLKKLDISSLEKIDEAYQFMDNILPKLGLVHEDTEEARMFLEKKKAKLSNSIIKGFGKFFKK